MKMRLPKPRKPKYVEIIVIWTFLTVGLLFTLQLWHESWSSANAYMSEMPQTGLEFADLEATQRQKLASGALTIEEAMQRIASADRASIPLIAPETSVDMAPAAGWMHHPDYVAPPEYDPEADAAETPDELEEGADEATENGEGEAAGDGAVRAPADEQEASDRPPPSPAPPSMNPAVSMMNRPAAAPAMMNPPAAAPAMMNPPAAAPAMMNPPATAPTPAAEE